MIVLPFYSRPALAVSAILCVILPVTTFSEDLKLNLRLQQETSLHSGRFHQLTRDEAWNPEETAIIVCDVWDLPPLS